MRRHAPLTDPFPDPSSADANGVVCAGAAPDPELLKIAYGKGIFPWPHKGMPLLWFSPDPRYLVRPHAVHLHRSLRKVLRKTTLRVTADTAFPDVMAACSIVKRPGQRGTWITSDMKAGYLALHREGFAHSVEAWDGEKLVGGLYGVSIGAQFCGESMFAHVDDASKVCFAVLAVNLLSWGFHFIDCQTYTEHTSRFGTVPTPRAEYLRLLAAAQAPEVPAALRQPGPWTFVCTPRDAAERLRAPLPASSESLHRDDSTEGDQAE